MTCPSHSISYNGSHCACAVGHLLNQTSNTCVLFAANSTISIDSGIDTYAISFPETIFSFDSIKKFTQSQAVFLQATLVLLLSWLVFCFFLRFMKLGNDGRSIWFRLRWWVSRLDVCFATRHWLVLIVCSPQSSMEDAKSDACLKAIEELHKLGALNDYLLIQKDNTNVEELVLDSSDSESIEDEDSRGELHEMLVPAALKGPWTNLEDLVSLSSYYIKFIPDPNDRTYRSFGLFVKAPLPVEAETMELDLHLAHGRSVMTKLVPSGFAEFGKDEIMLAQKFQEMFLKLILDQTEFVSEFVPLGKIDSSRSSSSTFYLLLPVTLGEYDKLWEKLLTGHFFLRIFDLHQVAEA